MTSVTAPPREDLCRSVPFNMVRSDEDNDGRTLEGYAATFNSVTRIDSWEGTFDEQIAPGAFRKSIRERTPRLQFDHGHHPLLGGLPLGRITDLTEDDRGLHVLARLSDNWLIQPFRDAIAEGAVDGMSFRFTVVREEWRDANGKLVKPDDVPVLLWDPGDRGPLQRTLKEVKVAELGPVVWPAYESTEVGVRSVTIDLASIDKTEQRTALAKAVFAAERGVPPVERASDDVPDAPPPVGHPSVDETPDAPSPEGHPSADPYTERLRSNISEVLDLMRKRNAEITKE